MTDPPAARYGSPVHWHSDWGFYPHTNDDLLAVGVCIDAATAANGAMLVIPRSHHRATLDHHLADGPAAGQLQPQAAPPFIAGVPKCVSVY